MHRKQKLWKKSLTPVSDKGKKERNQNNPYQTVNDLFSEIFKSMGK